MGKMSVRKSSQNLKKKTFEKNRTDFELRPIFRLISTTLQTCIF